jgi:hypothetical protein
MTDNLMDLADTLGFQIPARQGNTAAAVDPMSTPGGPVSSRHGGREESPTPAIVAADSEGRAGLTPPGAVPSMPKPLGPPRFGGTNPPPPPPPPFPPPHPAPPPGLAWLPALMLPSLLLLAAIDYTAWAAWWI